MRRGGEPMKGRQEGMVDASVFTDRNYRGDSGNRVIVNLKGTMARSF